MKIFLKKDETRYASSFPCDNRVATRFIRKTGVTIIRNGSNLFHVPHLNFQKITVFDAGAGVYDLTGISENGVKATLASFGSQNAANSAFEQVSKLSMGRAGVRWSRWILGAVALYVAITLAGVVTRSMAEQSALAARAPAVALPIAPQLPLTPSTPSAHPGADPEFGTMSNEELERLAKGGEYKFNPQIQLPAAQAPQLNCN